MRSDALTSGPRATAAAMARRHGRVVLYAGHPGLLDAVVFAAMESSGERGQGAQVFVADEDGEARRGAEEFGYADRVVLFPGSVDDLLRSIAVEPTLLVVMPGGMAPKFLSRLALGAVVLTPEDMPGIEGLVEVRRSCGLVESRVPCAAGVGPGLPAKNYRGLVAAFSAGGEGETSSARREAREALAPGRHVRRGVGSWPFVRSPGPALPRVMPSGRAWPRISIVTPSFNQGRYLEETILSVANQRYPDLEHIIVDACSKDSTSEVLARHRARLSAVIVEPDEGQSDAINKGFARATGTILTWLNSDDMLAPGALAAAALALDDGGADVVAGICRLHKDGEVMREHLTSCEDGPLPLDDLLDLPGCWLAGEFFYQPEVMFTRRIFDLAGGHVARDAYYSMDYDLWVRMARIGARLKVIARPMALYRLHEGQKTAVPEGYQSELPHVRDRHLRLLGREARQPRPRGRTTPLRVAFFNDLGWSFGAGIAHRRLATALTALGHEVHALSAARPDPVHEPGAVSASALVERLRMIGPDLVVVGNLHGSPIEGEALGAVCEEFATAFVMHDLWLLSGRCAYPGACEGPMRGCDERCDCPGAYPRLDPARVNAEWERKRSLLLGEHSPLLLGDSRFVAEEAGRVLAADPRVPAGATMPEIDWIRYGFELDVFRPRDRVMCRELLGLPRDAFIILTASASVRDPRKGMEHLAQALARLRLPGVLVAAAGWFGRDEEPPIPGMRAMGYMEDPVRLAMLYSAADLFVGPSLEEAFGQVFVEAAACGTPSVGYPVGGVPEAIADGVSGRVAARVDPEALADAIEELHDDPEAREAMGAWGRLWTENEWSIESAGVRFMRVLRGSRLGERLALGRRTSFAIPRPGPPEPVIVARGFPAWHPGEGFGRWQGDIPNLKIPKSIWAHGPIASWEHDSPREGTARLVVTYRCWIDGQRIRLARPPETLGDRVVEKTEDLADRRLEFEVRLRKGTNRFEFHFHKWYLGLEGPPVAMLVTSITFDAAE